MWNHVLYQAVSHLYKQNKFLRNKRVRECSLQMIFTVFQKNPKRNEFVFKSLLLNLPKIRNEQNDVLYTQASLLFK